MALEKPIPTKADDEACEKLWDIYANQAQQYDEKLVRSWNYGLDNIVVFSGLYIAALTSFILESYKNLRPDPVMESRDLLQRISQQLASPLNNTGLTPIPNSQEFTPTRLAVASSFLFSLSLGFAFLASFLAITINQWTRRFLHRTSATLSSGEHAHLLRYLYFGLRDYKMHTVVELVSVCLYISLFCGLGGMSLFLHDLNKYMSWLVASTLALAIFTLAVLMIGPVLWPRMPYDVPFTPLMWKLWYYVRGLHRFGLEGFFVDRSGNTFGEPSTEKESTLPSSVVTSDIEGGETQAIRGPLSHTSTIFDSILMHSQRDRLHDSKCILWTVKSLTRYSNLLPLIEALPDVLLHGYTVRKSNIHLILPLLLSTDPAINIFSRILHLRKDGRRPWHSIAHRTRCEVAGARALYALANVIAQSPPTPPLPSETVDAIVEVVREIEEHPIANDFGIPSIESAIALYKLSIFRSMRKSLEESQGASIPTSRLNLIHSLTNTKVHTRLVRQHNVGLSLQEALDALDKATLQDLTQYTIGSMIKYPRDFKHTFNLFVKNGLGNMMEESDVRVVFGNLAEKVAQWLDEGMGSEVPNHLFDIFEAFHGIVDLEKSRSIMRTMSREADRRVVLLHFAGLEKEVGHSDPLGGSEKRREWTEFVQRIQHNIEKPLVGTNNGSQDSLVA